MNHIFDDDNLNIEILKYFIKYGLDLNDRCMIYPSKYIGVERTLLTSACDFLKVDCVKFLLENKADPNLRDGDCNNAFETAISSKWAYDNINDVTQIISILLQHNAHPILRLQFQDVFMEICINFVNESVLQNFLLIVTFDRLIP